MQFLRFFFNGMLFLYNNAWKYGSPLVIDLKNMVDGVKSVSFYSAILTTCGQASSSWQRVAKHRHPGNVWPSIVMKQNYKKNLNICKNKWINR